MGKRAGMNRPNYHQLQLRPDNDRRRARRARAGITRGGRINRSGRGRRSASLAGRAADQGQDGRGTKQGQDDSIAIHGNTSGEGRHVRMNKPSRP